MVQQSGIALGAARAPGLVANASGLDNGLDPASVLRGSRTRLTSIERHIHGKDWSWAITQHTFTSDAAIGGKTTWSQTAIAVNPVPG
jgi:hypothetical protein